jgi:hypothetical protein
MERRVRGEVAVVKRGGQRKRSRNRGGYFGPIREEEGSSSILQRSSVEIGECLWWGRRGWTGCLGVAG